MQRYATTTLTALALTLLLIGCPAVAKAPVYLARIVAEFPHDANTSTQGLLLHKGLFYESSGGFGKSFVAIVDPATGKQIKLRPIERRYFAEGLTLHDDKLHILTWKSGTGFTLDVDTLESLSSFDYRPKHDTTEGWGLTHDHEQFILSCGTARLYTHRFKDFKRTGSILVRDGDTPVHQLNELEYVDGLILSNIWKSDRIAVIDPITGNVTHWIDLTPLRKRIAPESGVANGIAYDPVNRKLYVTGKNWNKLFEITIDNAPWR